MPYCGGDERAVRRDVPEYLRSPAVARRDDNFVVEQRHARRSWTIVPVVDARVGHLYYRARTVGLEEGSAWAAAEKGPGVFKPS